jgi:5-formyltetrahydrofolate cyclo-ligase
MRNLNQLLGEEQLTKPLYERKKFLRKLFIHEREILYQKSLHQDWGTRQFFRTLELLGLDVTKFKKLQQNNKINIACFFPIKCELDIACLADENWIFPKVCENKKLKWFKLGKNLNSLIKNKFGISELPEEMCFEYSLNMPKLICFLPGLAASQDGYRLGYGGGYYDLFLSKMQNHVTSILCLPSDNFVLDAIPSESHDQKIDLIVW